MGCAGAHQVKIPGGPDDPRQAQDAEEACQDLGAGHLAKGILAGGQGDQQEALSLGQLIHLVPEAIPLLEEGGHLTPEAADLNETVLSIGKVSVI